jgi:hypothetical protein
VRADLHRLQIAVDVERVVRALAPMPLPPAAPKKILVHPRQNAHS